MEMIIILASILQSVAISLGVGCSTLAIVNFFVAIADGNIDANERRMMGVVYVVLRIAMIFILLTAVFLTGYTLLLEGVGNVTIFTYSIWSLIFVLFMNSFMMTKHLMPSTVGPALQAATWYTLGVIISLVPLGLTNFSYFEFIVGYCAAVALAVALVNGTMHYLKSSKR